MNHTIKLNTQRSLLLAMSLLLALSVGFGLPAHAASTASSPNSTYDHYFNDIYPSLKDKQHVYQSVTYHELDHLLNQDGTYFILFGGAWSKETQAVIGPINEVAHEYGVTSIYHFDPRLDGKSPESNIIDSANNPFSRRYVDIVNKYLTNLTPLGNETVSFVHEVTSGRAPNQVTRTIEGEASKIELPFLFIYNRNHKDEANLAAPIIASVEGIGSLTTDGQANASAVEAYKAKIRTAFDTISASGTKQAKHDTFSNTDYIVASYNQFAGTTIFDESDHPILLDPVTYDELTHILESEGKYVILFGCSWCGNTRAIAKLVNEYAQKYNIDKVYNWDTKLDGGIGGTPNVEAGTDNGNLLHTRNTGHEFAHLYVDLVNHYLPNIETIYDKSNNNVSYTDANGKEHIANKLQVPYLFIYDKDHKDEQGRKAPILGHVELMYSWTNIQPDYESGGKVGVNYNRYTEALDDLFSILTDAKPQDAPENIVGIAPGASNDNGQITGTSTALEYKRAEETSYQPVTGSHITGLSRGTYYVRYAATPDHRPSPSVIVDLNHDQAAPTGLKGISPTSFANNNGQIEGVTTELEYKKADADRFEAVKAAPLTELEPGTYHVRSAAKYGYNASPVTEVQVPAYAPVLDPSVQFSDIEAGAWYEEAVSYLGASHIVQGTSSTQFSPNTAITRGEFIVWLFKTFGIEPAEAGADNFADAGNASYTNYLAAAKQLGIAQGTGDNLFAPERAITRQDLFTLLHATLEQIGLQQAAVDANEVLSAYQDANLIADYATDPVASLIAAGIVQGNQQKIAPQRNTTRAEVAQLLYNLITP